MMTTFSRFARTPRRRHLPLAVLLALAAPLVAHAGSVCSTAPATTPGTVSGNTALACGNDSSAQGEGATAFGNASQAGFIDSTDPANPVTHGSHAVAVGDTARALGDDDVAIGANSFAEGHDSPNNSRNWLNIAIGQGSNASGIDSIAVGAYASTTAPGTDTPAGAQYGIALGSGAAAEAANSVALGFDTATGGQWAVAIGQYDTYADGESSVAIGNSASTTADAHGSVNLLSFSTSGSNAIAIGTGNDTGTFSINVMGDASQASGISIGNQSGAGNGQHALFIGYKAGTWGSYTADNVTGIGFNLTAHGTDATALGNNSYADADADLAIGYAANTNESGNGTALGADALNGGTAGDLAVGYNANNGSGNGSVIGAAARAVNGSLAIGSWYDGGSGSGPNVSTQTSIVGADSLGIGANTQSGSDHDVLLGADTLGGQTGSAPSGNAVALGYGSAYDRAGSVSVGGQTHGGASIMRQIIHVAAGSADTDAIDVAQMNTAIKSANLGGGIDEAKAKTYIDAGDAKALGSAHAYTDNAVASANASVLKQAGTYADQGDTATLKAAEQYTDQANLKASADVLAGAKTHADAGDAAALAGAKAHADAGDQAAHGYVDQQIAEALKTANDYADANDKTTLAQANAYTDSRLAGLGLDDINAFRSEVDRRFHTEDDKLNRAGALGAAMAGMSASAASVSARSTRLGVALGAYHDQSAFAVGVQHAFTPRITLTLGAGVAGSGDTGINLGFGARL